jgi:predicted RNA-binding protein with EMAP domain
MDIQTEALKQELHNLINLTDDLDVLTKLKEIFPQETNKKDWWDELSEQQKENIKIGIDQLDRGEGIPHEVVMTKMRAKYGI